MKKIGKIKKIGLFLILFCLILGFSGQKVRGMTDDQMNNEIKQLNLEIKQNKERMEDVANQKEKYAKSIKDKQGEAKNLKNQLAILDNRIAKAELDIEEVKNQISEVSLEVRRTEVEIQGQENNIEKEKKNIANVLKLLSREGDASTLEILLMNDSLAEFLNRAKYLEDVNKEMGEALTKLKQYKNDLEKSKADLEGKKEELANLKNDLEQSRLAYEQEKVGKELLLAETKNSENEYQDLLAQAEKQELAAQTDIAQLEKTVRLKLESLQKDNLEFNDNGFIWPVPKNLVTTYFHDPDYPFRYLFEHPAVDIRAGQGTAIKAPASGYVARVKFAGKAYAYIMIIHGDGVSTVYGHISKPLVAEDDYVVQGQTIALSGGMPGTNGAGSLTTGPHLHFEVRQDGVPVDPLEYLP
ncbi:MAG: peptidoglycan DD-metalloendopeptidase family protein [Patescibacteria group bacterium]